MKLPPLKYLVPGTVAGLALLYTGIGFLAVPAIVKSQASQFVAEKFNRQLTIERVEFNPFTLAASLHGLKLSEPQGGPLFASFERLGADVSWQSVTRLAPVVQELRLTKPYVRLVRSADNHYNIDDFLKYAAAQPPSPEPSRFSLNNIQLEQGAIDFDDQPAGTVHKVADLKLGLPFVSSLPSDVAIFVEPLFSARVNGAPLLLKGKARPFSEPKDYAMDLTLDDVDVTGYMGYLPYKPVFKLPSARLSMQLNLSVVQPKDKSPTLALGGKVGLKALRFEQLDGKPMLKLNELAVQLGKLDLLAGRYDLERIAIDGLEVDAQRARDGKLNFDLLAPPPAKAAAAAPTPAPAPSPAAAKGKAPTVSLKELAMTNTTLHYSEEGLKAGLDKFGLTVKDIAADMGKNTLSIGSVASEGAALDLRQGKRPAAAAAKPAAKKDEAAPMLVTVGDIALSNWSARVEDDSHAQPTIFNISPLSVSLQEFSTAAASTSKVNVKATVNKTGELVIDGKLALAPFNADLALDLKNFDLLPLQPYVTDYVNLRLTQAAISSKAKLQLASGSDGEMKGSFKGDVSLNRLATVDKTSANDFLSWKSLAFSGMDLQLKPFSLNIAQVALNDFFARVIIDPNGRLNVQDIKRSEGDADKSLTEAGVRAQAATAAREKAPATPATQANAAPVQAAAPKASEPMPPIRIGKLALSGGRVRFTDNFIKPNYTANLKELSGTVSNLSSDPASNAKVDLRGVVNGAPLLVGGRVNPLKQELSLDLKSEVRGMELSSLSAYSDKYVGYGIEKGKLTFEVAYQLENRQLKAENRLVLDQLTFGKESTNPEATKLPVNLAVALLSDRNGVIDINVPIGGSLDDPQFSVGGIVLKIIGNAIMKAVTAPFALLGSLFGGGEELSMLEFEAGHAALLPASEGKLKSLAKALTERPGLKLDITGRFDAVGEIDAMKRNALERKLRSLKTKDLVARGTALPEGGVVVAPAERNALLARVFKEEAFAKPRNFLGMQKSQPPEEMEKMILANTTIDEQDLHALGNRRAQAAKDWLTGTGQVPAERIFIVSAKPSAREDKGSPTRVDFSLH